MNGFRPLRIDAVRTPPDKPGKVGKGAILSAVRNFLRFRVNRHQPAAIERSNIGPAFFVERKIPCCNGFTTVAKYLGEGLAPLCPAARVILGRIGRTTFRPVHLNVRIFVLYAFHPLGFADVTVPGNRVGVLANVARLEFPKRAPPQVVVVVYQRTIARFPGQF